MDTMMSLTTQRPSAACSTTFIEPVFLPRKKSSVGLRSVMSVSATPSVPGPDAAADCAGVAPPGPDAAGAGRPARLEPAPPTTIRAAGKSSLTTRDLPSVR